MTGRALRFRPHHFLCALGFQGKGYSGAFTANMAAIVIGRLRAPAGDATEIEAVVAADTICAPCPKPRGDLCESQDRIARLDAAHAFTLDLRPGDRLTWGEAKDRIRASVPSGASARAANGSRWGSAKPRSPGFTPQTDPNENAAPGGRRLRLLPGKA